MAKSPCGNGKPAPAASQPGQLLTLSDVAALTQVSTRTIQREVARGRLGCVRVGHQVRFRRADINVWLLADPT